MRRLPDRDCVNTKPSLRNRMPGEYCTRDEAIKRFCTHCMGWDAGGLASVRENVMSCPSEQCWLYEYRVKEVHVKKGHAGDVENFGRNNV